METVKLTSKEILELVYSTCSKRCVDESCSCIQNGLLCTDASAKVDCQNNCELNKTDGKYHQYNSDQDEASLWYKFEFWHFVGIFKGFDPLKMLVIIFIYFISSTFRNTSPKFHLKILTKTKVMITEIKNITSFSLEIPLKLI